MSSVPENTTIKLLLVKPTSYSDAIKKSTNNINTLCTDDYYVHIGLNYYSIDLRYINQIIAKKIKNKDLVTLQHIIYGLCINHESIKHLDIDIFLILSQLINNDDKLLVSKIINFFTQKDSLTIIEIFIKSKRIDIVNYLLNECNELDLFTTIKKNKNLNGIWNGIWNKNTNNSSSDLKIFALQTAFECITIQDVSQLALYVPGTEINVPCVKIFLSLIDKINQIYQRTIANNLEAKYEKYNNLDLIFIIVNSLDEITVDVIKYGWHTILWLILIHAPNIVQDKRFYWCLREARQSKVKTVLEMFSRAGIKLPALLPSN